MARGEELRFRPYAPGDLEAMAEVVGRVWHASPDALDQRLQGGVDVATCLARSTFSRLAFRGERLLGFALARCGDVERQEAEAWTRVAEGLTSQLQAHNPALAERFLAYAREERRIDARLLAESGRDERFELVLFLLAPEARGQGVGGRLYACARDHFAQQGAPGFFLFTDESCTWGFYEHKGLRRAAEYHPSPEMQGLMLPGYYLYVDDLGRGASEA